MGPLWRLSVFLLLAVSVAAKRKYQNWPTPPPFTEKAETARYLAHYGTWGVFSAVAPEYGYYPFGTIQSFADGPLDNSTGTPYFYIANISDTYTHMKYNNSISLTVSEAESDICASKGEDPEEPTCARVILSGEIVLVDQSEQAFAKNALFTRHPAMKGWPTAHGWYFYKLEVKMICLLDYYGGATHLSTKDYFAAKA